jgi:hypothetical protein
MDSGQEKDEKAIDEHTTNEVKTATDSPASTPDDFQEGAEEKYVRGWRRHILTAGCDTVEATNASERSSHLHRIWISLFLSTLETTIVSTSLVAIADSLDGFEARNWVITAYFLTYTGKPLGLDGVAAQTAPNLVFRLPGHLRQASKHLWPQDDVPARAHALHGLLARLWLRELHDAAVRFPLYPSPFLHFCNPHIVADENAGSSSEPSRAWAAQASTRWCWSLPQ